MCVCMQLEKLMGTPRMNKMFEDSLLILAMIKNLVADGKPNGLSLLRPPTRILPHLVSWVVEHLGNILPLETLRHLEAAKGGGGRIEVE